MWLYRKWQRLSKPMDRKRKSCRLGPKRCKAASPATNARRQDDACSTMTCIMYNAIWEKAKDADGIVVGFPVYYAGPNGSLCALLDRLFYSASSFLRYKPAAAVAVCRRGGACAAFDRLNKYFTINCMPVVNSQYWNSVHGLKPGEASQDAEGLQTMRTLGNDMAWILRSGNVMAIPKASRVTHVEDIAKSLDLVLTEEDMKAIDQAFPPPTHKYIWPVGSSWETTAISVSFRPRRHCPLFRPLSGRCG